jgi:hypothetical protein
VLTILLGLAVVAAMGATSAIWTRTTHRRRARTPHRPAAGFTPLTPDQIAQVCAFDWDAAEQDLTDH